MRVMVTSGQPAIRLRERAVPAAVSPRARPSKTTAKTTATTV
jgi:hypothetical protein